MRIGRVPIFVCIESLRRVSTGVEGMLVLLGRLLLEYLQHLSTTFNRRSRGTSELKNAVLDHIYPFARTTLHLEVWADE